MTLAVVGAGLPRTGTESLKFALEQLGFAACYHMVEVVAQPHHLDHWERAAEASPQDWESVFTGYRAAVDFPAMFHWRRLLELYPAAPVVLTTRDPDAWFDSIHATVLTAVKQVPANDPETLRRRQLVRRDLVENFFADRIDDRPFMLQRFAQHQQAVIDAVPAARLLVFDVREGWSPLCRFLRVDVPDTPFPRGNSTAQFQQRFLQP